MVVPWIGFPLSALINQVQPKGNAPSTSSLSRWRTRLKCQAYARRFWTGRMWKACGLTRRCIP